MARIRTIKPGFFKDEVLAELPMATRLLFIGLWCLADKEGRLQDRPKRIKAELFPYDNIEIDQQLSRLQSAGFINRYEVGEMKVIQIINFLKHQRITGTEATSESDLPEFTDECVKETTWKQQGNTLDDRKGEEGNGLLEGKGEEIQSENFDEQISSIKNKKKEKDSSPGPEILFTIEHCLTVAMSDERWVNKNKASPELLTEFNDYLEGTGVYEKNPMDYKSHFHRWKNKQKNGTHQQVNAGDKKGTSSSRTEALRNW